MKYKNTGKYLTVVRKTNLMTQAEFAESIGIHPQFVSNYERGLCLPPSHVFKTLKKYIDVKMFKKKLSMDYQEYLDNEYGI